MVNYLAKLKKHMKKEGFNLIRCSSHMIWKNTDGIKIVTSCSPKSSQYENIFKEISRDIKKVKSKK
jgi:predicted RNA binding protein YcfA (HicA-like mRNA interferase family)